MLHLNNNNISYNPNGSSHFQQVIYIEEIMKMFITYCKRSKK